MLHGTTFLPWAGHNDRIPLSIVFAEDRPASNPKAHLVLSHVALRPSKSGSGTSPSLSSARSASQLTDTSTYSSASDGESTFVSLASDEDTFSETFSG